MNFEKLFLGQYYHLFGRVKNLEKIMTIIDRNIQVINLKVTPQDLTFYIALRIIKLERNIKIL